MHSTLFSLTYVGDYTKSHLATVVAPRSGNDWQIHRQNASRFQQSRCGHRLFPQIRRPDGSASGRCSGWEVLSHRQCRCLNEKRFPGDAVRTKSRIEKNTARRDRVGRRRVAGLRWGLSRRLFNPNRNDGRSVKFAQSPGMDPASPPMTHGGRKWRRAGGSPLELCRYTRHSSNHRTLGQ